MGHVTIGKRCEHSHFFAHSLVAICPRMKWWPSKHIMPPGTREPNQDVLRASRQGFHGIDRALSQTLLVHPLRQRVEIDQHLPTFRCAHCKTTRFAAAICNKTPQKNEWRTDRGRPRPCCLVSLRFELTCRTFNYRPFSRLLDKDNTFAISLIDSNLRRPKEISSLKSTQQESHFVEIALEESRPRFSYRGPYVIIINS